MKKFFATIALLTSIHSWASTTPIEPVLVPIKNESQNIDIQMGKYEVTIEEFTRFINATSYQIEEACHLYDEKHIPRNKTDYWNNSEVVKAPFTPVVCISADDAIAYVNWLAKSTGRNYRLAEFYEWEFAASVGKKSRFSFGDDLNKNEICRYENVDDFSHNAGLKKHHGYSHDYGVNCNDGSTYQAVVGMYRPNAFGLHDMLGNIREITQTCGIPNEDKKGDCLHYIIAGGAWHWIPNPQHLKNNMRFNGSIEGFRLVLDSSEVRPVSEQTQRFITNLAKAQYAANAEQKKLKSLPKRVQNLTASLSKNQQVKLQWSASQREKVSYSIYRSYLDLTGEETRKMTKIAEALIATNYVDNLPGSGAASYQVFATNYVGESQASHTISVGAPYAFKVGERIQGEFFHQERKAEIYHDDQQQSVFLSSNDGYYPPDMVPYSPAWVNYKFVSTRKGSAALTLNVRGEKGSIIEFWQGKYLIAKITLKGSREFEEIKTLANLVEDDSPLEIRNGNNQYFMIDWFEFQHKN